MKKKIRKKRIYYTIIILFIIMLPFFINFYILSSTSDYIILQEDAESIGADCILVLGAGLKPDGTPNHMLQDRLDVGITLYLQGAAPKLLLSGDNGQEGYDEVNAMKRYVLAAGIPAEDIFMDHAGFSTYESMYRAGSIFKVKSVIIITQKYHQYRAIYDARKLGLNAYGVVSEPRTYFGQGRREIREILARNKDYIKLLIKPEPTYLGEVIPISGSGLKSHD